MSYSGGDGQSLGIILTPKHITNLFCDLLNIKSNDIAFDPCCGSRVIIVTRASSNDGDWVLEPYTRETKYKLVCYLEYYGYILEKSDYYQEGKKYGT